MRVSRQKTGINIPIPRIAGSAAPLDANLFDKRLHHLKPNAKLHVLVALGKEDLAEFRVNERVVLKKKRVVKTVFFV